MIIECPSCSSRFNIPDSALDAGPQRVRCSKCKYMWKVKPPQEEPAEDLLDAADMLAKIEQAQKVQEKKNKGSGLIDYIRRFKKLPKQVANMYAISYGIIVVCLVTVVSMWMMPDKWGMRGSDGFVLENLSVKQFKALGGDRFSNMPTYIIQGNIRNIGDTPKPMPVLRVRLEGEDGEEYYVRSHRDSEKVIAVGESMPFVSDKLKRPDEGATRFIVEIGGWMELALRGGNIQW